MKSTIKGFIWKDYREGEKKKRKSTKIMIPKLTSFRKNIDTDYDILLYWKNTKELYTISECLAEKVICRLALMTE